MARQRMQGNPYSYIHDRYTYRIWVLREPLHVYILAVKIFYIWGRELSVLASQPDPAENTSDASSSNGVVEEHARGAARVPGGDSSRR